MREPTKNELYDIYLSPHPTVQELETYREHCNYESTLRVTELKLEATKTVPTVLEETMSIAQLYESGSPLVDATVQRIGIKFHYSDGGKHW